MVRNKMKNDRYHPYGIVDPFEIPEIADKLLVEYWDIAEKLKLRTFIFMATCLGFVREDGYIEGDNDVDVAVFVNFRELADLTAELVMKGFVRKNEWWGNRHFVKENLLLDVSYGFPSVKYFQSFDTIEHSGKTYNVPHPVKEYLKDRFGDWQTKIHRSNWQECELCKLERKTKWYYEDDHIVILECKSCKIPMVVFREHGMREISATEEQQIMKIVNNIFKTDAFQFRKKQRNIATHPHWHIIIR